MKPFPPITPKPHVPSGKATFNASPKAALVPLSFAALIGSGIADASPEDIAQKLTSAAGFLGADRFRPMAARVFVEQARPEKAIPDPYAPFRPLIKDALVFFLSRISQERLIGMAVRQISLGEDAPPEARLLELAKGFPTLHKLGQIIARNPHIDPQVKQWLIHLESGSYGTDPGRILQKIKIAVDSTEERQCVAVDGRLLSEASVGAVVAFQWRQPGSANHTRGVFKVLKPRIKAHLKEELGILEALAVDLENNRSRYDLGQYRYIDVFREVRQTLEREIDVTSEQTHLMEAHRFYRGVKGIRIPRLLPLSTRFMTAMELMDGPSVAEMPLTPSQGRRCAAQLFEAVVGRPLFSVEASTPFHGDPHAGNILAMNTGNEGAIHIALVDWSLSGRLGKAERRRVVQLIQQVIKRDSEAIASCVAALTLTQDVGGPEPIGFKRLITTLTASPEYDALPPVRRAFWLLDELPRHGMVFSSDLMLFRKALFTLEGVLTDLDPGYEMDTYMARYLGGLITQEWPDRVGRLFFPFDDEPGRYPSLMSNGDLQLMLFHQFLNLLGDTTDTMVQWVDAQSDIMSGWFGGSYRIRP